MTNCLGARAMRLFPLLLVALRASAAFGAVDGTVKELAEQWISACGKRDAAAWQQLFSAEARYEDSLTPNPVRAATHPGPFFRIWGEASAWQCSLRRVLSLEGGGAMEWVAKGKVRDFELEFTGLAIFGLEANRFAWMHNYFDTRPFLQLLRAPGAKENKP